MNFNDAQCLRACVLPVLVCVCMGTAAVHAQTYTYDQQGRLSTVVYADGSSLQYDLDALGNRLALAANEPLPSAGGGGGGGGGCFIATAAYGSPLDPHVQSLRDFRDEYMLTNVPGRYLIGLYEHWSPPIAGVIERQPALRFATQLLLAPIVLAASYPHIALALILIGVFQRVRRRRARRGPLPA